jgi:hypothetical protein
LKFEWAGRKAAANLKKHGVTFDEAAEVFYDPDVVEDYDPAHSGAEDRFFVLGFSSHRLLYVVYAQRSGDVIRIISARPPTPAERRAYEEARA